MKTDEFFNRFEEAFLLWAEKTDDIRAAFIVGSRARADHSADKWSDLDIILYANNHEFYLYNTDWLEALGNIWVTFTYHTSGGEPERLTIFEDGYQVDIVFHSVSTLRRMVKDRTTPDSFCRGVRVLVDKDNVSGYIVPSEFKPKLSSTISEAAFIQTIIMFLFASVYIAKQIFRGELWTAKTREYDLKALLLQMMEWHAKAMHGEDYDIWHAGRFLHEWVDQKTLEELKNTFGLYEKADSFRALMASMNLFRRLSVETANKLRLRYPEEAYEHITNWINENKKIMEVAV